MNALVSLCNRMTPVNTYSHRPPKSSDKLASTNGIAGITGKLASLIFRKLLNRSNVSIRGFCRNATKVPHDLRSLSRITVVEGSVDDMEALRDFTRGCNVVICCDLGDTSLMREGQKLLVNACDLEGVSRYVASDYCLDFTKLEYGHHPAKDPVKQVKEHLETRKASSKGFMCSSVSSWEHSGVNILACLMPMSASFLSINPETKYGSQRPTIRQQTMSFNSLLTEMQWECFIVYPVPLDKTQTR
jgi:hypothetical protein